MNKYEQLIEYIINEDEDKAKALFHEIVVEKSRDIYEGLMDEETVEEEFGGNEVADLVDEIQADETDGISEEDDEEMDADAEMMGGDEDEGEEEHEELEDKVMDLEQELDALKAEFDALMADEMDEPEHADMKMGDEEGAEELEMYEGDEEVAEDAEEVSEDAEEVVEEDAEEIEEEVEEVAESKTAPKYAKTASELMREYVEKISAPSNTEGADNKSSVVAGKNDMGGTAVDPTGEEKGASTPKVAPGKEYKNTAGGKAPMEKAPSAHTAGEEGGVNKDSVEKGGN